MQSEITNYKSYSAGSKVKNNGCDWLKPISRSFAERSLKDCEVSADIFCLWSDYVDAILL